MKANGFLILALTLLILMVGCSGTDTISEQDGATKEYAIDGVRTEIGSTEIEAFFCKFSMFDLLEEDSSLAGKVYCLEFSENSGSYTSYDRFDERLYFEFAPHEDMAYRVQEIINDYDFAQHNGSYYHVDGLPEEYGVELSVKYASGEAITAYNNQDCFLPVEALEKLEKLFREYL